MVIAELLEEARQIMRLRRLSLRTEQAYLNTIRKFIRFHGRRHPEQLGAAQIRDYLSHLAIEGQVAASTQNVALNALVFLYRHVLQMELAPIEGVAPARWPDRLPVVYSRQEVRALLACLDGMPQLMASLLYGAGLRLMECVRLRVKDLDFDYAQITIRDGKGQKDRRAVAPHFGRATPRAVGGGTRAVRGRS